ncbi:MAG: DUF2399 domain-containing protein [Actinomycetota bacterium]|nr:DUF2399 domain-containing protein [Actinomycetota bacterium]
MTAPESLRSPDLDPVFRAVQRRLERYGTSRRGRMKLPGELTGRGRYLLRALQDGSGRSDVDLDALEKRLAELGVGNDLAGSLRSLGYAVSAEPAQRRRSRQNAAQARQAARDEVGGWDEDWAGEWIEGMVRGGAFAGLEADKAVDLVRSARAVLDRIDAGADAPDGLSRVDLAAAVLGDSHALDPGTVYSAAVTRALMLRHGGSPRQAWERAGVSLDRVSAPVLTWGLVPVAGNGLFALMSEALALDVPLHLSQLALRRHPLAVAEGSDVLVVENPRVVEAACERRAAFPVVALNGNPAGAARLLIQQLLDCGASLRYHGDFDAAGLRICGRMHRLGLRPWRMDGGSYVEALAEAEAAGARLPRDSHRPPPTPWDPDLQLIFDEHRLIVHEERLLPMLLSARAGSRRGP